MIRIHILSIIALGVFGGACSQATDAYITGFKESRDGRAIVFSTHPDNSVYVLTKKEFANVGRAPFSVSETGQTVVAIDPKSVGERFSVIIRRDMENQYESRFEMQELCPSGRVVEVRCDDESIYIQLLTGDRTSETDSSPWYQIVTAPNRASTLKRVIVSVVPAERIVEGTSEVDRPGWNRLVYQSDGGLRVIQLTPPDGRSTISSEIDGASQILLEESLSRFWIRQAGNRGLQYP
jgi:hypothetical protein